MAYSGINFGPINITYPKGAKVIFPYSPPPWYVQYAPEIALAIVLASLGILVLVSPRFRSIIMRYLRF
ncbi:hypothetical protein [Saccharolobus shibatae]|uniref:Uncharacterized protein n=1 Tax=Saccharolobus shibatae TaxID=2286 RepID=A0A8F5BVH2_9CREN|nr:hypothetical protein [Saccharolobus shibatae]QXJ32079.1 hypothetical protein J5U21_01730 [Saccharolobus shibatae]